MIKILSKLLANLSLINNHYKQVAKFMCCSAPGLIVFLLLLMPMAGVANDAFPRPAQLEPDVNFWKRVYTEINTDQGYIHDDRNLSVVYEKINLPANASRKTRQRYVKRVKKKYKAILKKLAKGNYRNLNREESRILALWPKGVSKKTLRRAINQTRFQRGQSDKFREGLIRSGMWKPYILEVLDKMDLPREISALPHVESSFNHKAYSKVGAAGMWQFMRSTGRRFMRVDHVVDERMDPLKATVAAARLLDYNFKVTGTWPLALISYNHGSAGMRRASRVIGTTDIVPILRKYSSRTFKFASRNFYVAFLAAVEIDKNSEKYFGKLVLKPPFDYEIIKIPAYMTITGIGKALGLSSAELKLSNPALRSPVWNGNKYVPKNYELKIDNKYIKGKEFANNAIASIDPSFHFHKQKPDRFHRVRRGQTLSVIAARYGVRVSEIVALNGLRNRHSIRAGKTLRLPQKGKGQVIRRTVVAENRSPDIGPIPIPESGKYKVRRGDNIDRIAKRFGITSKELQKLNRIRNKNRIYPGQYLTLAKAPSDTQRTLTQAKELQLARVDKKQVISHKPDVTIQQSSQQQIQAVEKIAVVATQDKAVNVKQKIKKVEFPISETLNSETTNQSESQDADSTEANNTNVIIASVVTGEDENKIANLETVPVLEPTADQTPLQLENISDTASATVLTDASEQVLSSIENEVVLDNSNESIGSSAISDSEDELLADPSDYSVFKNKTIEIQAAETLGHYAEWLQLRASRLRRVNSMRYGTPVVVGRRLKLDFSRVTPEQFEQERVAYHRTLQGEFFEQYQINGTDKYKLRRGQSIWVLANRKYKIPIWLLRQYNPDLDFNKVRRGTIITFPKIEARSTVETTG